MEYRITLAIDRCTALMFRFLAASWWTIHSHVVEFVSAILARFRVRWYVPWVSSYGGVWSLQGSSYIFWEFCFISSVRALKGGLVISVTLLKVCCQSDVSFSRRRCSYTGFVDYIWLEAFSFQWAIWFLCAIAGVRLLLGELKFERTYLCDERFHVRHAWVSQF